MGREPWVERLPLLAARPWTALAITVAAMLAALGIRLLLHPVMPSGLAFVTFFPAVLLVSFLLGARMGAIAVAISLVLAWMFLITDPMKPSFIMGYAPAFVPYLVLAGLNVAIFHTMQAATAKLRLERARSAMLAQTRETLFRELQHRVSNNLQVAAGLLALQKKHVGDEAAREAVDEASRRLAVIGRVSRQLYDPAGAARSMRDFLDPLCADVVEMSGRTGIAIRVQGDADAVLGSDAAIPLALIVAETVANAIEHGFDGRDKGEIEVMLSRDTTGALQVEVHDDGRGLPEGFDLASSSSLGLGIVRAFADQLGGTFELIPGERTTARLTLPA
jgi:two-component sensor histidine kinase